jgi:hypothetical protein
MRLATTLLLLTITGTAWAGDAVLDPTADAAKKPPEPVAATSDTPPTITNPDDTVSYGVDLRIRNVRLPKFMLGWFLGHAADGSSNTGIGADFIRRKGTTEISLGFEYEHINIGEGVYVEPGKAVPGDPADYLLSPEHSPNQANFGWFTVEFNFVGHTPINQYVSFRYGLGAGLGFLVGDIYRWDVACAGGATNDSPEPGCDPGDVGVHAPDGTLGTGHTSNDSTGGAETTPVKYDLGTPVFPVINAFVGFQFHPFDKAVINIEGGLRTLPYIGLSLGYFIN